MRAIPRCVGGCPSEEQCARRGACVSGLEELVSRCSCVCVIFIK